MEFKSEFTNLYPISKTLRFRLIPQGKTLDNIGEYLEGDNVRSKDAEVMKELITRFDRNFIFDSLKDFKFEDLQAYLNLFNDKSKEAKGALNNRSKEMREDVSNAFNTHAKEIGIDMNKILGGEVVKLINNDSDLYCKNNEEKDILNKFSTFSTYLKDYSANRANIYDSKDIPSSISNRIVNENLPIFIKNMRNGLNALDNLDKNDLNCLKNNCLKGLSNLNEIFEINYYNHLLLQEGIDIYNNAISGFTLENGDKVQGFNELINLYNQTHDKKLGLLETLNKQILGNKETFSYRLDEYKTDDEVIKDIKDFYANSILNKINIIKNTFNNIENYDSKKIFIENNQYLTNLSKGYTGSWDTFNSLISDEYDIKNKKETKKYLEEKEKYLKNVEAYSIDYLQGLVNSSKLDVDSTLIEYIRNKTNEICINVENKNNSFNVFFDNKDNISRKLSKNDKAIAVIKELLDSIKELQHEMLQYFDGSSYDLDEGFMNVINEFQSEDYLINNIYNKVRNYITKKPYSTEKIKLSFDNVQFLAGWDINKEKEYLGTLLRKDNKYYLGILNKDYKDIFDKCDCSSGDFYEKIIYKQIPSCAKYFSSKQINPTNPPENIKKYLSKDFDKKKMSKNELKELIKYVAEDFIPNYEKLHDKDGNLYFNFKFKKYDEYVSWKQFCDELDKQSYAVKFIKYPESYVDKLVSEGKLFLFQIYCKDFSDAALKNKSKKNLHTMYFESLFNEENINDLKFKLNGGAMMFFRKGSLALKDTTIHQANKPILNKNELNNKKQSVFDYEIIKDRRYTCDQFMLHLPITINPNSNEIRDREMNLMVRKEIKNSNDINIIGIDRGERNLIYISVINSKGEILEQKSLNVIENKYDGNKYETNYHDLLNNKEKDRLAARQNWNTIENIKELKEGYVSICVNEIVKLVRKYNALIALEDLNSGFKNSRIKVEKQVYQKFEKQLIEKLNYVVDKNEKNENIYGVMNGLQLSNKFDSFKAMSNQNGIMFYVYPWLTSKIDPTTGFVNLLKTKYENQEKAKVFISKMDSISYDNDINMFVFDIDYSKYEAAESSYKKKWKIYSNGERIKTFRNPEKSNQWDSKEINLTNEYINLLEEYGIKDYSELKEQILSINKKDFYERFMNIFSLNLQMRNSVSNTNIDYMISPVKNNSDEFYMSNDSKDDLPKDADANGAYHIALKLLLIVNRIKEADDLSKVKLAVGREDWLRFAQQRFE